MIIDLLKSIPREFILTEQQIILGDQMGYAMKTIRTFKPEAPNRLIGNAYMVVDKHFGSGAGFGFVITIELIRKWFEEELHEAGWLDVQYDRIKNIGSDSIGKYVCPLIDEPKDEMARLADLLTTKSMLRGFIQYGDNYWENFSVGAYLFIGLLLHAESFGKGVATTEE